MTEGVDFVFYPRKQTKYVTTLVWDLIVDFNQEFFINLFTYTLTDSFTFIFGKDNTESERLTVYVYTFTSRIKT